MTSRLWIYCLLSVMLCVFSDIDDTSAHRDRSEVDDEDKSSTGSVAYVRSTLSTQSPQTSKSTTTKLTAVSTTPTTKSSLTTDKSTTTTVKSTTTTVKSTTVTYATSQTSVSVRKSGRDTVWGTFSQTPTTRDEQANVLNVTPSEVTGIGHNTLEIVIIIVVATLVCLLVIVVAVVVCLRRKPAPSSSSTPQKTQSRDIVNPVYRMGSNSEGEQKSNRGPYLEPRPTVPIQQGRPANVYHEINEADVESQKSARNSEPKAPATHDYLELLQN